MILNQPPDQNVKTLVDMLRELHIGETLEFPVERVISVRSTISRLKLLFNFKYSCIIDREKEVALVTRKKDDELNGK